MAAIDPTKPVDGVPADKGDLRANLQSARDGIEGAGGADNAGTSITINAASFGDSMDYLLVCTAGTAVGVTLGADVPAKKALHIVQKGAGLVTVAATNVLTGSIATTALYDSLVFRSLGSGEWVRVQTA